MIDAGLVEEVRSLADDLGEQSRQAVGYAEILAYLRGEWKLEEAVERIKINSRQFAKHQRTWFRKFPMARWVEVAPEEPADFLSRRLLELIEE